MIQLWDKTLQAIKLGDTSISAVYLGEQKLRPTGYQYHPTTQDFYYLPLRQNSKNLSPSGRPISESGNISYVGGYADINGGIININVPRGGWKTISLWIQPYTSQFVVGMSGDGYSNEYLFSVDMSQNRISLWSHSYRTIDLNTTAFQTHRWHHVLIQEGYGNRNHNIYVNGVKILNNNSNYRYYEIKRLVYYNYQGRMTEAIISARKRTDQEVIDYYNQTKEEFGL